jgi:hypothetical protein
MSDEEVKDHACMMVEFALIHERFRQVWLEETDWLPWWEFVWGYLRVLWMAVRAQWRALRAIRKVAVHDPEWSWLARQKFLADLERPVERLPDGSYVIGRGTTIRIEDAR